MNTTPLTDADLKKLKQWPWREARDLEKSLRNRKPKAGKVLFETGFGPSGLPHIGTFAEVARTTWIRWAYELLTGQETALVAFSDNMDGMRKVPTDMPNQAMLAEHIGLPLCRIPDPFGTHESYSAHMNGKLKDFLDHFGFDYEFRASSDMYSTGVFNDGLVRILQSYDAVRKIVLSILSDEVAANWSPFMPICTACGRVLGTTVLEVFPADNTVAYSCECGHRGDVPVTDGHVKVGWKVDWALRWFTFGVNYEMYGKDLIDSYKLSSQICRVLGETPPVGMFYEMFLDEKGGKISKSRGNGLTIDEWLEYGPLQSLALFIFKRPIQASRLYFDVIPQHVDEYLQHISRYPAIDEEAQRLNSPIWFIDHDRAVASTHAGFNTELTFSTLLNLVAVLNTEDPAIVWDYILRYRPEAIEDKPVIDELIGRALAYYRRFVLPTKAYAAPAPEMQGPVEALLQWLDAYDGNDATEIQNAAYAVGNEAGIDLKAFFKTMYQLLIGQEQGPRLGTFIQIFGVKNTLALAREKLLELGQDGAEA